MLNDQEKVSKALKFSDILITVMVAIVFGLIYKFWGSVYGVVSPLFLKADQLTYGMWFIAGPIAFLLIRKPGVALLAELAASSVSALIGSEWGIQTFVYGIVQGLGCEIIFALFLYRNYSLIVAGVAGLMSGVGSFVVDLAYGYANYELWMLVYKYGLRMISSFVIAGVFAYLLVRALEKTGVTKLIRPVSKSEYASLND
ncbi:thiamine ABC transporter permease [Paenibacillus albiflavus]|uniref:Thiamine ABC transporter permease n=1 Tax=Paenibacillus albiflavus TaxID=2545760 RepID=A0A4R4EGL4_9BACL|nr:ECF transporter S component [Paenibacillus albiflavus]TCZ77391.1 thiamine ABC transporter permease [Paenibacillus albiflavus]